MGLCKSPIFQVLSDLAYVVIAFIGPNESKKTFSLSLPLLEIQGYMIYFMLITDVAGE